MDTYYTIEAPAEAQLVEQRSRFIAYAIPVETAEQALEEVTRMRARYYDARHVCWAYRLGPEGAQTRSQDDGEPSGTAGKPILGQILSADLTNIIVLVVRYFGGVKLGTSGLIEAYRQATVEVLAATSRRTCIVERRMQISFGYDLMGDVMRLAKDSGARILAQDFREHCTIDLCLRADDAPALYERIERIYGTELRWLDASEQ